MGAAKKETTKKSRYIVFERKLIQRVPDPDRPDEYEEVEAFIPVCGLDSGREPMAANSGPEACRLYARRRGVEEGEGSVDFRACSERNWSGTGAGLELQLTFKDVLPPSRKQPVEQPVEDVAAPDPEPEPEPTAA